MLYLLSASRPAAAARAALFERPRAAAVRRFPAVPRASASGALRAYTGELTISTADILHGIQLGDLLNPTAELLFCNKNGFVSCLTSSHRSQVACVGET